MKDELVFFNDFMFRSENGDWFIKPICDFFGLEYDNQADKISKDKICQTDTGKFPSELVFGDKRLHSTLRNRGFSRWIQMISASNVRVELREKFEIFQANIFDFLWEGNIEKTAQLEDIRTYAENLNAAVRVNRQVMDYIVEQKHHRDLCLASPSKEWARIKLTLVEEKVLPDSTEHMKAIVDDLPNDIEELRKMKHMKQANISRNNNRMIYGHQNIQKHENPMPEGFRKEMLLLSNKDHQKMIEIIDQKIITIQQSKQLT